MTYNAIMTIIDQAINIDGAYEDITIYQDWD